MLGLSLSAFDPEADIVRVVSKMERTPVDPSAGLNVCRGSPCPLRSVAEGRELPAGVSALDRDDFSSNRHPALYFEHDLLAAFPSRGCRAGEIRPTKTRRFPAARQRSHMEAFFSLAKEAVRAAWPCKRRRLGCFTWP